MSGKTTDRVTPDPPSYDISKIERIERFDERPVNTDWGVVVIYNAPQGQVRLPFFHMDELGALLHMEQQNRKKETE